MCIPRICHWSVSYSWSRQWQVLPECKYDRIYQWLHFMHGEASMGTIRIYQWLHLILGTTRSGNYQDIPLTTSYTWFSQYLVYNYWLHVIMVQLVLSIIRMYHIHSADNIGYYQNRPATASSTLFTKYWILPGYTSDSISPMVQPVMGFILICLTHGAAGTSKDNSIRLWQDSVSSGIMAATKDDDLSFKTAAEGRVVDDIPDGVVAKLSRRMRSFLRRENNLDSNLALGCRRHTNTR